MDIPERVEAYQSWLTATLNLNPDFESRFDLVYVTHVLQTFRSDLEHETPESAEVALLELDHSFVLLWIEMASTWMVSNSLLNLTISHGTYDAIRAERNTRLSLALTTLSPFISSDQLSDNLKTLHIHLKRCLF